MLTRCSHECQGERSLPRLGCGSVLGWRSPGVLHLPHAAMSGRAGPIAATTSAAARCTSEMTPGDRVAAPRRRSWLRMGGNGSLSATLTAASDTQ
jgi:hypothetical protein